MGSGNILNDLSNLTLIISLLLLWLPGQNVPPNPPPPNQPPPNPPPPNQPRPNPFLPWLPGQNVPPNPPPPNQPPPNPPPPNQLRPNLFLPLWLPGQNVPPNHPPPPNPRPRNQPPPNLSLRTSVEFDINSLNSHNQLDLFYRELFSLVAEPFATAPTEVLLVNRNDGNYLTDIRFTDGNDHLTVFVRSHDLSIVGFQVNGGKQHLLDRDLLRIPPPVATVGDFIIMLGGAPLNYFQTDAMLFLDYQNIPPDFYERLIQIQRRTHFGLLLGPSYGSLEATGGIRRRDMMIDQRGLLNAFRGLVSNGQFPRDRSEIARSLLYFTQFISEALRINPVREHIVRYFTDDVAQTMPDELLMLEHGWERASYRLQNPDETQHSLVFGVHTGGNVLSLEDMRSIYSIIIRGQEHPAGRVTQVNMRARYEYSLREFERSRAG